MYDYFKRFLIAMAIAVSIGLLFLGATVSFAESSNFIWPTEGLVTDTFGTRNGKHYGIDIAAPRGTTVVSVGNGVVTKSYYSNTYGNVIFIEHKDGFETVYAHLDKRFVQEGATVQQGEKIGTVGNTGRSSGDHLHFEVHDGAWTMKKNNAIDPFLVIGEKNETFFALSKGALENKQYKEAISSKIDENGDFTIKVKQGDSLWSIASKYQVTVDDLKSWNRLKRDRITVNQELKIVGKGKYIVQQGDTLWSIAEQSGTTVATIKKMNGLKGDLIQVGTSLTVDN